MSPNQKLFNTVVTHLRKQNCKATLECLLNSGQTNSCAYRGDNGTKCAFGCLIPDELYNASMENQLAYRVIIKYEGLKESLDKSFGKGWSSDLIASLQTIHDWTSVPLWEEALAGLASEYKLEMPPKP